MYRERALRVKQSMKGAVVEQVDEDKEVDIGDNWDRLECGASDSEDSRGASKPRRRGSRKERDSSSSLGSARQDSWASVSLSNDGKSVTYLIFIFIFLSSWLMTL